MIWNQKASSQNGPAHRMAKGHKLHHILSKSDEVFLRLPFDATDMKLGLIAPEIGAMSWLFCWLGEDENEWGGDVLLLPPPPPTPDIWLTGPPIIWVLNCGELYCCCVCCKVECIIGDELETAAAEPADCITKFSWNPRWLKDNWGCCWGSMHPGGGCCCIWPWIRYCCWIIAGATVAPTVMFKL